MSEDLKNMELDLESLDGVTGGSHWEDYVVQEGDSIGKVAVMFCQSTKNIILANPDLNLTPRSKLTPGTVLHVWTSVGE